MSPIKEHEWEAQAVFNPAVIEIDGKVHMIYRALSPDNTSTFGYAYFDTPLQVAQRLADPIYLPREDFEAKKVPNGNSGCEDARVTVIGEWVYMCYTAYNGAELPRVAFTKISKQNFLAHNWVWEKPVLISPPGIDDKDAALFPEKIHDRYYFLHRIDGDIVVDYIDDLNFEEKEWLGCRGYFTTRKDSWDSLKVGLNSPPIRTPKGWLVVYHGVHVLDHEYRVGGILLDLKDPRKEIARSEFPFLEPEYVYEREGVVPNVVFPCGAVVLQDTLYMYYGGADTVIGVATMNLTTLVDKMLKSTRSD